jgi:Lysozyme like domain
VVSLKSRFGQATGDSPVLPLLFIMVGAYLAWFGIKYWEDQHVIWPSDPIKDVLQGKGLPPHSTVTTAAIELTAAEAEQASAMNNASGGGGATSSLVQHQLPPAKGHYSDAQLRALWIAAGGDPSKAAVAACIATHESSGDPGVTSPNPGGGTNVGLWQLDTPGGKGAGFSVAQLKVPLTNARVAVRGSSNGTDWSAWSTAPMCGV